MTRRPDILWIVTTQWRAQAMGYAGDPNARTPFLDALATEAVNYSQAVTPHPLGPQARAALMTGVPCPENGVSNYWDALPVGTPTVAHRMAERGYATAFFGKWHLSARDRGAPLVDEAHARQIVPPEARGGFEFWEGFESGFLINDPWLQGTRLPEPRQFKGFQADVLVQRAATWMRDRAAPEAKPLFWVVSLESPHPPYHAPVPNVSESRPEEVILRRNVPPRSGVVEKARDELAGYYAAIEATDRAVGRLLAEIELPRTVVIFTSAHGDMHGSHGLFRKAWPHEESARVPLLVRGMDRSLAGGEDRAPVSLVDLADFSVAIADGREWRCPRDRAEISMPSPPQLRLQCPHAWRGWRSEREKFVVKRERDGREVPWLYFNLADDPDELRNLVADPAQAGQVKKYATEMAGARGRGS